MISPADLDHWFTYHAPTPESRQQYANIRMAARIFAGVVLDNTPSSPDQTVAIRKIREAAMVANASIACGGR